jgi:hypothetical protein
MVFGDGLFFLGGFLFLGDKGIDFSPFDLG